MCFPYNIYCRAEIKTFSLAYMFNHLNALQKEKRKQKEAKKMRPADKNISFVIP